MCRSQITNLFVTSIKDITNLSEAAYDNAKNIFETQLGISDLPDGMNTNPYDSLISPVHSNKFSVLNLSLSSLIEGLKITFSDNSISNSEILTSIYNEISSLSSPLSLSNPNNLSETGFIGDIIEDVVLGNSTINDGDLATFQNNSSGISACVKIIENFNTYSLSGGDANSSIIAMHEALIAVYKIHLKRLKTTLQRVWKMVKQLYHLL